MLKECFNVQDLIQGEVMYTVQIKIVIRFKIKYMTTLRKNLKANVSRYH